MVAILAAFPTAGTAASLSRSGTSLSYSGNAGEVNRLVITEAGGSIVFTDAPGIVIAPVAPCTAVANVGTCPAVTGSVSASTANLNDEISVSASVVTPARMALTGGAGSDTITGSPAIPNTITGDGVTPGAGDRLTGGARDDSISGDDGPDEINGGAGNDSISGDAGNDVLNGAEGNDSFEGDSDPDGSDAISGGPQLDLYNLSSRSGPLSIDADGVADDGEGCPGPACESDNVGTDIERLVGGLGNDIITGNAGPNELEGNLGSDVLSGGDGPDIIGGGGGGDQIDGGTGDDQLSGDDGADGVSGGEGDDVLDPDFDDSTPDVESGGPGVDTLGSVEDFSSLGSVSFPVRISLNGAADDGYAEASLPAPGDNILPDVENVTGGGGNDVLSGSSASNELVGAGGNDRLSGGKGLDGLIGGRGDDSLAGGKGRDLLEGDGGADRINSRDKRADEVFCGSAVDVVKADRSDRTTADCDKVKKPRRRQR